MEQGHGVNIQSIMSELNYMTKIRLYAKCMLKFTITESTNMCQDEQFCAKLKPGIGLAVHGVQDIWDPHLSTEN